MILVSAKVGKFRSINTEQVVRIDPAVTVLVGMNEAGKTVLLKNMLKALDAQQLEEFDPIEDYPRRDLSAYLKKHASEPASAITLTYRLSEAERAEINDTLKLALPKSYEFSVQHKYNNGSSLFFSIDETPAIKHLAATAGLSTEASAAVSSAASIRSIPDGLSAIELTDTDKAFLAKLQPRIAATKWDKISDHEFWQAAKRLLPKFLYFSDYDLLPGKLNLADLAQRLANAASDPASARKQLQPKHQAVLALLRMADVDVKDFAAATGFEEMKAKIEAVSISLTDQVLEFWKQNEDLEVEVAIANDSTDEAPFNNGPNLYLRIKNRKHRGVSTPFDQRSRGFIWFFSFLVWFDSVQHQLDPSGKATSTNLVLLLDEPGLALHALAQADFLRYIDDLAKQHQVIYTTHSPFMVNSDRLHQVRVVEDKDSVGTTVSDNISSSGERTIFPLQAALGWTIAQNLFVAKRNLIVEGPTELSLLQAMSALVEAAGGKGLREDLTIVPVGGLGNVVTFVSLLGANGLRLAVLHDYNGKPDQKLEDLIKQKLLSQKSVFNMSQFRDLSKIGQDTVPTDIEDLLPPQLYVEYVNSAFKTQLAGSPLSLSALPPGDRIVQRIERHLADTGLKLRPSGGYNHYLVAAAICSSPPHGIDSDTQRRFSVLFDTVNKVL